MSSRAPAKQEKSATKPLQKIQGHTDLVYGILHLPGKRRIITCSNDGSLRVWDLESGTQIGDAWNDQGSEGVCAIALSPDSKTVASGSRDSAVRLWDIDRGKVIKKWMGHTKGVGSVCWSGDGGRVVSGSPDQTFRVWDVESGRTILGPIETGSLSVDVVRYSPNSKMIATAGGRLRVWDANTGEQLKTLEPASSIAWTLDGKTLITGSVTGKIRTLDVATWTETAVFDGNTNDESAHSILLSPNERILASISLNKTVRLWNLQNNKPIGPPLNHEHAVNCVAFSADEKFLATGCRSKYIFTWDVSAILKDAGLDDLLSDNNTVNKSVLDADATRRVPQIKDARRIPLGFFDDVPHRVDSSTSRGATEHATQSRSSPLNWAQRFVSGMLRRRDRSGVQLRVPIVEVPLTAGKPRNYHARGKQAVSSSRPLNPHTTQQHNGATHSNLTSLQQLPAAATASTTLPTVTETSVATGTTSPPDITIRRAGWRARFLLWVCCVPIQNTNGQH